MADQAVEPAVDDPLRLARGVGQPHPREHAGEEPFHGGHVPPDVALGATGEVHVGEVVREPRGGMEPAGAVEHAVGPSPREHDPVVRARGPVVDRVLQLRGLPVVALAAERTVEVPRDDPPWSGGAGTPRSRCASPIACGDSQVHSPPKTGGRPSPAGGVSLPLRGETSPPPALRRHARPPPRERRIRAGAGWRRRWPPPGRTGRSCGRRSSGGNGRWREPRGAAPRSPGSRNPCPPARGRRAPAR